MSLYWYAANLPDFNPVNHLLFIVVDISHNVIPSDLYSNLASIEYMAGGLDTFPSCTKGGATGGAGLVWLCYKHLHLAYHWSQQYINI